MDSNPKRGEILRGKVFFPQSNVKDWDILKGKTWVFPLKRASGRRGSWFVSLQACVEACERMDSNPKRGEILRGKVFFPQSNVKGWPK